MKKHANGYTHTQTQANVWTHAKQKQQARNRAEGNKSVKRKKGGRTKECKKGFFSSVGCQQRLLHFLSICFLPFLSSCFYFFSLLWSSHCSLSQNWLLQRVCSCLLFLSCQRREINKAQTVGYWTQADFSGNCTLLEYLFFSKLYTLYFLQFI